MRLRALVVDDEALARARLVRMLARVQDTEVVGEAATGADALSLSRALRPDLLLLDVDMPGLDGFGVAEAVDAPLVVFTTAHAQYAALAFEADAVDYLLKPVAQERLERALEKVRQRLLARSITAAATRPPEPAAAPSARASEAAPAGSTAALLTVHDGGKVRFFDPLRVTRFRAEDKYTAFSLDGEEHLLRESLSTLEERLAQLGFLRVHRAELVRASAIRALTPEAGGALLHLSDGQTVSVSRRFLPALRQALGMR
ncbi:LytR family transcriptional regulator [Sorangium cellulosum]|jgi:two-component system LytT family response regulator|uniref:LytR family transcriptional regulator n=1 Tax=Sorangium cellulosum TaxID=56 RepID=A0A4P2PZX1_SORCE|nr:LytTR family DNA-binding domain-containing protein [Sorangium cellulosum]AUX22487.1 LytR family transcriptional regulator [Sorangium cellulosum]